MKSMKLSILSVLFLSFFILRVAAQDCVGFFPMNEGSQTELQNYNPNDKLLGSSKQTVIKKEIDGKNVKLTIETESFDKKGKLEAKMTSVMKCENGVFKMDMKNFSDPKGIEGMKDMDIKMDATDLEFPNQLSVGQTLPNGSMTMTAGKGGMTIMTMSTTISNRKVEAIEKITVQAGTFECYKISQTIESKTIFSMKMKSISWYAKEVGAVRTETYNDKDKLVGYTILSNLKK
jgi:hypothetical protein